MIPILILLTFALMFPSSLHAERPAESVQWNDEIVYHVMPRSFRDSNGDGHGDFRGMIEGIEYLQQRGVTAVLLAPICELDFYHNYFPTDYDENDPEFGTKDDWIALVRLR